MCNCGGLQRGHCFLGEDIEVSVSGGKSLWCLSRGQLGGAFEETMISVTGDGCVLSPLKVESIMLFAY